MNNNRINFNFPKDYNIIISDYWLLGFIEAECSFYLNRSKFQPVFIIGLSKVQRLVIERIQEYLENNLGFDKYSMFKLKNSWVISYIGNEEINNARLLVRVRIINTNILTNYFIPFLNNLKFITKKKVKIFMTLKLYVILYITDYIEMKKLNH